MLIVVGCRWRRLRQPIPSNGFGLSITLRWVLCPSRAGRFGWQSDAPEGSGEASDEADMLGAAHG